MKHLLFCFVLFTIYLASCNDAEKGNAADKESKAQIDTLFTDVMDDHNIGMAKMGRLTRAEQTTRRLLDSIQKLPAKARQAAEPVREKLDSLQKDLSYAEFAMNKWMEEFNMDSAINNAKERIAYLSLEKVKVSKVKEAIMSSLVKADSLIKQKL
jgi:hypothetical protein